MLAGVRDWDDGMRWWEEVWGRRSLWYIIDWSERKGDCRRFSTSELEIGLGKLDVKEER